MNIIDALTGPLAASWITGVLFVGAAVVAALVVTKALNR